MEDRMPAWRVDVEVRATLVPALDWTMHEGLERKFRNQRRAARYASRMTGHGLAAEYRAKVCPASRPRGLLDVIGERVCGLKL